MKNDNTMTIEELKKIAQQFVDERDWRQFHTPKNLAINISVEANELLEKFIWMECKESVCEITKNKQDIADEAADVLFSLLAFCNVAQLDLTTAFLKKMEQNRQKYPIEKSKGRWTKYDKL